MTRLGLPLARAADRPNEYESDHQKAGKMKAIILAGGLGTRLKPFTEVIPKPLLPVGEKAVLEIQMEHLEEYGFDEIFLATNFKSRYIENFFGDGSQFGVRLTISKEEKPLGTVGPLSLLKKRLDKPFLVMNGDILTRLNFSKMYEFALEKGAKLTIGVKTIYTPFRFGNIESDGDFVTNIEEKPDIETNVLAGIYIMTPEIFEYIPDNEPYGMDQLIKSMLAQDEPIAKYQIKEYWLDIGVIDDYKDAQEIYNKFYSGEEK
jgi:NDP-sugar pyrophosphorylase family protein